VDARVLEKFANAAQKELGHLPATQKDFRKVLESKDVDAITIATPEHWHAPMAIAGLQAGKHVYDEKPTSHNPHEGELLLQAQKKYSKLVQVGSQQRSSPHTIEIIGKIHKGLIGKTYFGKAWYSNVRKSMGIGKVTAPPESLDWELWQGPAPRRPYRTTSTHTTGTGYGTTAPVKLSTTARTKLICAAGRSASIIRRPSRLPVGATTSRTIGSFTTRSSPASRTATA
jgi:hypothetical protein